MLRKIAIVVLLGSVIFSAACLPEGRPYKDSGVTGNYFYANFDPEWGSMVISGSSAEYSQTDVTFTNTPINSSAGSSDIFLTKESLSFDPPERCLGICPPLGPVKNLSIFMVVPANSSSQLVAVPLSFPNTAQDFINGGGSAIEAAYKGTATFSGENEFGYPVSTSVKFTLLVTGP